MISDNERREVARKIRETGEDLGSSALLWYHIAKALGVRTSTDGKTACGMLADLIEPEPELTCRNDSKVGSNSPGWLFDFKCSECGAELCAEEMGNSPLWVDGDAEPISYCPHCGARVEEDS